MKKRLATGLAVLVTGAALMYAPLNVAAEQKTITFEDKGVEYMLTLPDKKESCACGEYTCVDNIGVEAEGQSLGTLCSCSLSKDLSKQVNDHYK